MAQTDTRQAHEADFLFRVGSLTAEDLKATGFSGTEGISQFFHFQVDFCSDDRDLDPESIVGEGCVLEIAGSAGVRYVNGIVRRFSRSGEGVNVSYYSAEVVPLHWMLTKRFKSRVFTEANCPDMTVPGIIKKVLQDAGVPQDAYRFALSGSYPKREFVAQYRESEADFINRLAEHEGIFYFFEHTAEGHKMVFGDSPAAHVDTPNDAEWPFHEPSGLVPDKEFAFHVRDSREMQYGAVVLDSYNFRQPNMQLRALSSGEKFTSLEYSDAPPVYVEKADGDRYAKTRLEEYQASRQVVDMGATIRALIPGYKFTLTNHPSNSLNIEYLVTHISHRARQTQSTQEESQGTSGTQYEADVRCIPASVPYRPPRVTPKPLIHGTQTAIVVGPSGEEIYVDKYGRVKVHFLWDREGEYTENDSFWIRVSQAWVGGQWGMIAIPRVHQEVLVNFINGDPDDPIIVGQTYNGDHMPPYNLPDDKTKMVIKSSSVGGKGNNEIRWEDGSGKEQFFIQAQKDYDLRVTNDSKEYVGNDRHLIVKNNMHENITGDRHLKVDGDFNEKVGGSKSITIGSDLHAKAGMNQAFEAGQEVHIKAGMKLILEAGLQISLKVGGNFVDISPAGVAIKGLLVQINSGGAAGSGSGCSPDAPVDAKEADQADPGDYKPLKKPKKPYGPMAQALQSAQGAGRPFCEQCSPENPQQAAGAAGGSGGSGSQDVCTTPGSSSSQAGGGGSGSPPGIKDPGYGGAGGAQRPGGAAVKDLGGDVFPGPAPGSSGGYGGGSGGPEEEELEP